MHNEEETILRLLSRRWLVLAGIFLAAAIVGIVAAPWPTPFPEFSLTVFDPVLITVDQKGFLQNSGSVLVEPRRLLISAPSRSQPTVHLLTSEVSFTAVVSVSVLARGGKGVFPFQAKVWNPRAEAAVEAWYDPNGTMMAGVRTNTRWLEKVRLGTYSVGDVRYWRFWRDDQRMGVEVWQGGEKAGFEIDREALPALFENEAVSLTILGSSSGDGFFRTAVRDPEIHVPRQSRYGTTVHSWLFRPTVVLTALFAVFWLVATVFTRWKRFKLRSWDALAILLLSVLGLILGRWLSMVPGHPYDLRGVEVWSRTAAEYGLGSVVAHSLLATEGNAHGGQPYAPVTYQYPPLLTYALWISGRLAGAAPASVGFKMIVVLAVVAGGAILFALMRHLRVSISKASLVAAAYVLNPAILFDAAVWGQTEALVGLFLLVGVAGLLLESPSAVWTGSLAAVLTKQTGALFSPILIALGIARFGAGRMVGGLPFAIVSAFLLLTPSLLSGVHPSATYRPLLATMQTFGSAANSLEANAVVSQSAFTLWSTLAGAEGVHGLERMAFPDAIPSRLGAPYFDLSRLTFGLFVLFLCLQTFRKKRLTDDDLLLMITAYAVGAAILLTRVQPRYLYFGVMFGAASLPWMPRGPGAIALAILSGTMLVGMWGTLVLTSVWYPNLLPIFEPERSGLNSVIASILGSDVGITVGGFLNVAALLTILGVLRRNAKGRPVRTST